MTPFRRCAWSATALLLGSLLVAPLALADDPPSAPPPPTPPARPADLGAAKDKDVAKDKDAPKDKDAGAVKAAAPAKDAPADADKPQMTAEDAVARANAYLESARVMTADFVQIGVDGQRSEGQLYLDRPGRMLFHYEPPAKLEIVADGRTVAVRDQKLETQDLYFIAQTPLKFLLNNHVDLAKDTTIKRVSADDNAVTIEIEDKATFGGSAEIALVFDPDTFALKQWTTIDAQGFQTVVSLFNIDLTTKPDPTLFHIEQTPGGAAPHH